MMGIKLRTFAPLVDLSLEELVPADHFYRRLERALDLSFVRDLVADCYALGGRPSVDPVVFFKLQLVLFFARLHSERQLMDVVADRLSIRCGRPLGSIGYDLGESLPDHSSLTRIRERYGLAVFRRFFDVIVERCVTARLVQGAECFIDATQVAANAARSSLAPRFAVEAHLAHLFPPDEEATAGNVAAAGKEMPPLPLPVVQPQAVLEDLAVINATCHNWIAAAGRQRREVRHRTYRRHADLIISRTDPDATDLYNAASGAHLGYLTHYVIDGGKARIILRALVTPAEVHEPQPACDLLQQSCFRWKLRPRQVTGDSAYGTLEIITALEQAGIRAYVPLAESDVRRPGFTRADFTYDAVHDHYRCPEGQVLTRRNRVGASGFTLYRAGSQVCQACPSKARCTPSRRGRAIQRHDNEGYRDRVRAYHETEAYQKAMRKRGVWIEPLFGEAKSWHGLGRFRLRGLEKVNIEALLVASGQNIKRLLTTQRWGRPLGPGGAGARVAHAAASVAGAARIVRHYSGTSLLPIHRFRGFSTA